MKARWQGISYDKESVKAETGIENVEYLERFEEKLPFLGEGTISRISILILQAGRTVLP